MNRLRNFFGENADMNDVNGAAVFAMLGAFGGVYGFIYEIIFYYFNGGMQEIYWRGSCFGPWISIYGFGAFLIYFLTKKLKSRPLLVAIAGGLGCGVFELISGAALYYIGGRRGWNYNSEMWNFGNIGGFVCLRSVAVFMVSSLALVYIVVPFIALLQRKMSRKAFVITAFLLGGLFAADMLYNLVIAPRVPLLTANEFYQRLGLHILDSRY